MGDQISIFEVIKKVLLWLSPIIFVLGFVLIMYSNYKRLEEFFGKQALGIQYKLIPALETNIYNFHEWLLERRTILGLICVIFSIVAFFIFRK